MILWLISVEITAYLLVALLGISQKKMDFLKVKRLFEPWNANEGESRPFDKER